MSELVKTEGVPGWAMELADDTGRELSQYSPEQLQGILDTAGEVATATLIDKKGLSPVRANREALATVLAAADNIKGIQGVSEQSEDSEGLDLLTDYEDPDMVEVLKRLSEAEVYDLDSYLGQISDKKDDASFGEPRERILSKLKSIAEEAEKASQETADDAEEEQDYDSDYEDYEEGYTDDSGTPEEEKETSRITVVKDTEY